LYSRCSEEVGALPSHIYKTCVICIYQQQENVPPKQYVDFVFRLWVFLSFSSVDVDCHYNKLKNQIDILLKLSEIEW
jgi:hypothetical protein